MRATLARRPRAARLALWGSVAATLAGALLALGGEMLLGHAGLAQVGGFLCLVAGGVYAGLRLLGARAAGPPPDVPGRPARLRGARRR